jgi:A/G-specific adenine glycosylase
VSAPRRGPSFAAQIVAWHSRHGRRDLPWQASRDVYRVWLSEVMLQQTQVSTVIPYFERFCARFPDVTALAAAPLADVLSLWSGLGYYARARNLHACAKKLVEHCGGRFPSDAQSLARLPGIGRSTAAAIAAFCFDECVPILDGNVKRVLTRYFGIEGFPGAPAIERQLWILAESLLPNSGDMPAYTQGLMDLGATLCRRRSPDCTACPLRSGCRARREARVDELPTSRPARSEPQRSAWALLALHEASALLQRRAPAGIWGGLLAPPQFDSLDALLAAARALDGSAEPQPLAPRRHAFTHFTLTLRPYRLDLRRLPTAVREDDQVWLPLAEIDSAALPAPVRVLLRELSAAAGQRRAERSASGESFRPVNTARTRNGGAGG